ncbi:unnamed protein product [Amoebophrya sp. A25]|nr:unnamed protein product [Amoebophrya sp. A25]|eukprot:GSA25T00008378001.1
MAFFDQDGKATARYKAAGMQMLKGYHAQVAQRHMDEIQQAADLPDNFAKAALLNFEQHIFEKKVAEGKSKEGFLDAKGKATARYKAAGLKLLRNHYQRAAASSSKSEPEPPSSSRAVPTTRTAPPPKPKTPAKVVPFRPATTSVYLRADGRPQQIRMINTKNMPPLIPPVIGLNGENLLDGRNYVPPPRLPLPISIDFPLSSVISSQPAPDPAGAVVREVFDKGDYLGVRRRMSVENKMLGVPDAPFVPQLLAWERGRMQDEDDLARQWQRPEPAGLLSPENIERMLLTAQENVAEVVASVGRVGDRLSQMMARDDDEKTSCPTEIDGLDHMDLHAKPSLSAALSLQLGEHEQELHDGLAALERQQELLEARRVGGGFSYNSQGVVRGQRSSVHMRNSLAASKRRSSRPRRSSSSPPSPSSNYLNFLPSRRTSVPVAGGQNRSRSSSAEKNTHHLLLQQKKMINASLEGGRPTIFPGLGRRCSRVSFGTSTSKRVSAGIGVGLNPDRPGGGSSSSSSSSVDANTYIHQRLQQTQPFSVKTGRGSGLFPPAPDVQRGASLTGSRSVSPQQGLLQGATDVVSRDEGGIDKNSRASPVAVLEAYVARLRQVRRRYIALKLAERLRRKREQSAIASPSGTGAAIGASGTSTSSLVIEPEKTMNHQPQHHVFDNSERARIIQHVARGQEQRHRSQSVGGAVVSSKTTRDSRSPRSRLLSDELAKVQRLNDRSSKKLPDHVAEQILEGRAKSTPRASFLGQRIYSPKNRVSLSTSRRASAPAGQPEEQRKERASSNDESMLEALKIVENIRRSSNKVFKSKNRLSKQSDFDDKTRTFPLSVAGAEQPAPRISRSTTSPVKTISPAARLTAANLERFSRSATSSTTRRTAGAANYKSAEDVIRSSIDYNYNPQVRKSSPAPAPVRRSSTSRRKSRLSSSKTAVNNDLNTSTTSARLFSASSLKPQHRSERERALQEVKERLRTSDVATGGRASAIFEGRPSPSSRVEHIVGGKSNKRSSRSSRKRWSQERESASLAIRQELLAEAERLMAGE